MEKFILDTDMGPDCDDAGALAVLHNLNANILGITHCTSDIEGSITIKAINEWFGRTDIMIGRYEKDGFLCGDEYKSYVHKISEEYLKNHKLPYFYDAVSLLRTILSRETGVTLLAIGPLNNISNLLLSKADSISDKTGAELVKESVKRIVIMGGNFRTFAPEFNIECDIPAAQIVSRTSPVPIMYCGFETGENVLTGNSLEEADVNYPVRDAYLGFNHGQSFLRPSWDLVTVYAAVCNPCLLWKIVDDVKIDFDDEGCTMIEKGGKDSYICNNAEDDVISKCLENLIK
ncbi:MAG: nucleoside hydrolase [Oscillospiraceae bacterium]